MLFPPPYRCPRRSPRQYVPRLTPEGRCTCRDSALRSHSTRGLDPAPKSWPGTLLGARVKGDPCYPPGAIDENTTVISLRYGTMWRTYPAPGARAILMTFVRAIGGCLNHLCENTRGAALKSLPKPTGLERRFAKWPGTPAIAGHNRIIAGAHASNGVTPVTSRCPYLMAA